MKAAEARRLRIGETVVAAFGNVHKRSRIIAINWPHFTVRARLASGELVDRKARYASLMSVEYFVRTYGERKLK